MKSADVAIQAEKKRTLLMIGRRIAELRAQKGLTQERFAELGRITARYVQRIENGDRNISVETIAKFAILLDTSVADLFTPPSSIEIKIGRPYKAK